MTLTEKLDWLIDQWCERRELRPLQCLLRAYPGALLHTDQFGELLDALKDVKGLYVHAILLIPIRQLMRQYQLL